MKDDERLFTEISELFKEHKLSTILTVLVNLSASAILQASSHMPSIAVDEHIEDYINHLRTCLNVNTSPERKN